MVTSYNTATGETRPRAGAAAGRYRQVGVKPAGRASRYGHRFLTGPGTAASSCEMFLLLLYVGITSLVLFDDFRFDGRLHYADIFVSRALRYLLRKFSTAAVSASTPPIRRSQHDITP